ncbi:MAG: ATP-binding protein [Nostoc sp.]|uniref:sensor histidine kinase n=1 Tax=Nostoc sp. TaxID=1180 RepID=UPI002FF683F3
MEAECDRKLDLQRLESLSYPIITPDALLLQHWLPWVIEPFKIRLQDHQQTLQINLPSNLLSLFLDGISLKRILAELLNNAYNYKPAGDEIVLTVRHNSSEASAKTIITTTNSADISVTELPRIFDKFYRLTIADIWDKVVRD